ncbi:MAG TPA: AIR synthase-related protein [Williamwhitmania sp.]|nr:AIR synthase-related protein [Williamwhitmania sp.]
MASLESLKVLLLEARFSDDVLERLLQQLDEQSSDLERMVMFTLVVQAKLLSSDPIYTHTEVVPGWHAALNQSVAYSNGTPLVDGLERIAESFWKLAVNGFKPAALSHWSVSPGVSVDKIASDATKTLSCFTQGLGIPLVEGGVYISSDIDPEPFVCSSLVGIRKGVGCTRKPLVSSNVYLIGNYTLPEFYSKEVSILSRAFDFKENVENHQTGIFAKQLDFALGELFKAEVISDVQPLTTLGLLRTALAISLRWNLGMRFDVKKVLLGIDSCTTLELLGAETLNRLMVVCPVGREPIFEVILEKWDIPYSKVGRIEENPVVTIEASGEELIAIDLAIISELEMPKEEMETVDIPTFEKSSTEWGSSQVELIDAIMLVLSSSSLSPKMWFREQFDSSLLSGPNLSNPSDAGIAVLPEARRSIAMAQVLNPRMSQISSEKSLILSFAEATRKVICSGAIPMQASLMPAIFGDNEEQDSRVQELQRLFYKVCDQWGVVGSAQQPFIKLRPVQKSAVFSAVAILGVVDGSAPLSRSFLDKGDMIYLLGEPAISLAGSELETCLGHSNASYIPYFDIHREFRLQKALLQLYRLGILNSAHSVGRGGIFTSLVECGHLHSLGFDITTDSEIETNIFLFGESPGMAVVTVPSTREVQFIDFMVAQQQNFRTLGHVTKAEVRVDDISCGFINDLQKLYV